MSPPYTQDQAENVSNNWARNNFTTNASALSDALHITHDTARSMLYKEWYQAMWPDNQTILHELENILVDGNLILDAGCGVGFFSVALATLLRTRLGHEKSNVIGADVSGVSLEIARAASSQGVDAVKKALQFIKVDLARSESTGTLLSGKRREAGYDLIVSISAISKMDAETRGKALENCKHMLKPGGRLVLDWSHTAQDHHMARMDLYKTPWAKDWEAAGRRESEYILLMERDSKYLEQSEAEAKEVLESAGFEVVHTCRDYLWNGPGSRFQEANHAIFAELAGCSPSDSEDVCRHKITTMAAKRIAEGQSRGWICNGQDASVLVIARKINDE